MRRFAKMDNRLSRSMPMLLSPAFISPVTYRVIHPRWPERRHQPRHFYVGGVRTKLIGANSYPNPSHSPQRLVLCGGSGGSYQKLTRCSSTAELSRTGVYCSSEDLRDQKLPRRALSCEDVCRGASTSAAAWDSRFSESGVSLNDSRTDLGSLVGTEDVDGVSQCSFGSSSAFHEITGDSELDRPDSDCLSVPGSLCGPERALDVVHEGGDDPQPRGHGGDRHGAHGSSRKHRHDSGSREKFLTELTASSSGRSSPCEERKEFYHSTPTKRGSPVLSIFPGDEEDLHFPSRLDKESPPLRGLPRDSLPPSSSSSFAPSSPLSPRGPAGEVAAKTTTAAAAAVQRTSTESIPSSVDTVREVLKRSRQEFFSSLQDCSKLEEQTTGESVQSWLTTGHTQRRALVTEPPPSSSTCEAESSNLPEPHPHQRRQQPSPQSPLSGARLSVRQRVRALEQGPDSQIDTSDRVGPNNKALEKGSGLQAESCSGENGGQAGAEASLAPTVAAAAGGAEVGGAARFSPRQLKKQPPSETASQQRGNHGSRSTERAGGYELSQFGGGRDGETNSACPASSSPSPVFSSSPVHFADSPSREGAVKNQAREGSEGPRNQSGRWDAETAPLLPPPGSIDVDDGVTPPPTTTPTTAQLTTTVAYRSAVVSGADTVPDDGVNNDSGAQPRGYSAAKAANSESKSAGLTGTDSDSVKAAGFADREAGIAASFYTVTDDDTADGHGADLYSRDADVKKRAAGILSWLERGGEVVEEEEEEATTREESEKRCDYNHNAGHALGGVAATAHSSTSSRQDKGGPDNPTSPSTPSFNAPAFQSPKAPSPVTAATSDTSASLATLPPPNTDQQVVCTRLQGVANAPPSATMSAEHTPGFQRHDESAAPETATTGTDVRPEEEAPLVGGSEQHMPPSSPTSSSSVTVLEVSRHTRHVHRTTVEETVTTTHRTVRHGAASPTAPPVVGQTSVSYANGGGEGSGLLHDWDTVADTVTDRTVSSTVREEEDSSEREETSTSSFTRRPEPLPRFDTGGGRSEEGGECRHPHRSNAAVDSHGVTVSSAAALNESICLQPVDAATHLSTPSHPATLQQHRGDDDGSHGEESSRVMAGSGPASHTSAKHSLLDSLQEQLSLLSSEDVSFTSGAQSPRRLGQVSGYRDHAEASLPETAQSEVAPLHGDDAEDKGKRVRGTSSVCITLARGAVSGSTFAAFDTPGSSSTDMKTDYLPSHGPAVSEVGRETSLRHARVSQILSTSWGEALSSDEGEGRDGERGMGPESPLQHSSPLRAEGLSWRPPASSSSELDDSDGNYSSISTADSSRPPHGHSESDLPASEGGAAEDYDNVHSFHDFVSGLQGQSTSDQPSLHHSADMAATDLRSGLLRSPFIQETILEADDESETADELDTTDTTVSSFRSSLHFSLPPPQSTPKFQAVSPAPEIRLWSTDQHVSNLSATEEDVPCTLSPVVHPLQELSDRLSSVSGDLSYEFAGHAPTDSRLLHHHPDDLDLSGSRHSACSSPAPSDVSEGSVYSASATAEVRKQAELGASFKSAEPAPTQQLVRRNLSSALETSTSRRSQWVQEKALLFQRLLNDFEWQSRSSEQKLLDEMCSLETQGRGGEVDEGLAEKRSEACDDLYRAFTREHLEKRQNHVCPFIEDHLPVFRFRRFLRKKHNSKLAGHRTFRLRHRLGRLTESPLPGESAVKSVSDRDLSKLRQTPYPYQYRHASKLLSPSGKPTDRLVSDVFTDDADVKRSFSDSAYSTCTSRGDVSSIGTDLSMDSDKLTSLSDVFDQLDVCEGEIDQALLDRLRVGHYKAETL